MKYKIIKKVKKVSSPEKLTCVLCHNHVLAEEMFRWSRWGVGQQKQN